MTLTGLLAFVSGAVMARLNREPDPRDKRIKELESLCTRMAETLHATADRVREGQREIAFLQDQRERLRAERNALRQSVASLTSQLINVEGMRLLGLQEPPRMTRQDLAQLAQQRPMPCTCVPARADMLRDRTILNDHT